MDTAGGVRKRHVLYIPGFDPMPPRRYRELYRKEGQAQAAISGFALTVSATPGDTTAWQVQSDFGGTTVETRFSVLGWSDIVQASMDRGIWSTYLQLLQTAWIYLSTGALFRLMRLRKGPVIAALYPVLALLAQLGVALGVARLVGAGLSLTGVPMLGWLGLVVVPPILSAFRRIDNRLFAYYLMHDYAFSAKARGANPAALQARLDDFQDRLRRALSEPVEEVLLVGHSSGVHLGVHVLARLIRSGQVPQDGPALSFLSLGQVVPMVSFLPRAQELRADLAYLSTRPEIAWVDVTAPGDGCAFALCDPVAVSGVAPPQKRWPLVISAAFTQTLSPERWKAMRWRFFRLHFQYLCAFDLPGRYSYFDVTAGPETLARRYAGQAPSASCITTPLSPYRSVTP